MGMFRDALSKAEGSAKFSDALAESKNTFGNVEHQVETEDTSCMQNYDISADSSNNDILVYIMLFLCQNISTAFSAYKGGFVLSCLLPEVARRTEDIDFSISDYGQYEHVKVVLRELGDILVSKGIFATYEIKETISEDLCGGVKFVRANGTKDIGIDIGLHSLSYGVTAWSYNGMECNRFEVERMLSDKISAIYSRKRFRRTKDIYDFYIITGNFDVDLVKLSEYIENHGQIDWNADPFRQEVLEQYAKAYDKLRLVSIQGLVLEKPEFGSIITRLDVFMRGLQRGDKVWSHRDLRTSNDS